MATITLPAQTLTILDHPTPLADAVKHLDEDGYYTADVAIPATDLLGEHERGFDHFYDTLCNALSEDSDAFSINYTVVGVSEDGQTFYVRVSNNLAEYLHASPEIATEHNIDPTTLPH